MIESRIAQLREKMKEYGIDVYLVPTSDYHESEYVSGHFKCREFITGFTGSAGTAVVTMDETYLWTDGRYFVQAADQIKGSSVILMKTGEEGVPKVEEYLQEYLKEGMSLGFDGRVVNGQMGEELAEKLVGVKMVYNQDLIAEIWKERPAMEVSKAWVLEEKYCGESAKSKLNRIREKMAEENVSVHVLTVLDDIAWTLNIRGNDIPCNPVVMSYFIMTMQNGILFVHEEALDEETKKYLTSLHIEVKPYDEVYTYVESLKNEKILLEKSFVNYRICQTLEAENELLDRMNPSAVMKSRKNETEMENIRKAHIKDGVAVTKYMYWLKQNIGKTELDEISAAVHLEELRKEQEGYIEPSFDTISAYGANAAMCHYLPTPENHAKLKPEGLYLVDSGGQYYEGTTDITRTIVMGELTEEQKEHFTITAMGTLRLGNAKFLYGCTGADLDYLARSLFWERHLDFNHGTGHGVGYLLNVHERPNRIHWRMLPERIEREKMEEGMLTSNEPGIYIEGSHGIRTENLILCHKTEKNEYGQFMEFETVTFVPIDLDGIDTRYMTQEDVDFLNAYHRQVYEKLSPSLSEEEQSWLREYTREIRKSC